MQKLVLYQQKVKFLKSTSNSMLLMSIVASGIWTNIQVSIQFCSEQVFLVFLFPLKAKSLRYISVGMILVKASLDWKAFC